MIYEKRDAGMAVKREDMPVKDVRSVAVESTHKPPQPVSSVGYITRQKPGIVQRIKRRRRLRQGIKATAVFFAALAFCVFTLDAKLLHGRMRAEIGNALRQGARYTLENVAQNTAEKENTLYTRLLYDRTVQYPMAQAGGAQKFDLLAKEAKKETQETVAAASNVSGGFVDGTKFYPITSLDLSAESLYVLSNGTNFSPDTQKLAEITPKALENVELTDEPLVLIVHTHGEECYTEYMDMYPQDEATRSSDTDKNVVRVGKEIADTLSDFGVNSVHCTTMHDSESFINAYSGSASSVKQYLKQYPSIKIVVDVHRDAIIRDDGESVKAVTNIAGQDYAQLMFVVGTNELGHNHPDWQDNLSLALSLQKSIEDTYPSLCRSINLRNVPFNQQLSSGYLLLEVGTSANTLDEALRSARAFGENLARSVVSSQY
ncbi:MAG: stage II sporulation protein P [Clostridia bacterium]|nr:stage II sporulation protein P [Clostridia bacterium]